MATPPTEDQFNVEVLKLLLQVAWADDEVAERERLLILGAARSWNVDEKTLAFLLDRLDKGHPLPSPNMAMLKARADEALEAARALVAADGEVREDEKAMLEQLREMLGG
ncbi:MAG: TerB family tellurite resistance protein [Myxococcaceae bacterium]